MKSLRLVVLSVFAFSILSFSPKNDELKWYGFNEGYQLAKKKNKIMLVDVYTDWCGWCKRMDRDTYAKADIIASINKDYVPIKFNPEITGVVYTYGGKEYTNGQELAQVISQNQITGYPTTIFIYPKENKTNVLAGYFTAVQFKPILDKVVTDFIPAKKK
ncbi:MAG: thioredoxin family protein [Bacteroidota bacterium]|jgi:uncharacterized protein YyaL (SSP411 family)